MKRYLNKLIAMIIIVLIFSMVFNFGLSNNVEKRFRTLANQDKLAGSCTTGSGTTYYVTGGPLNIRSGPSTSYTILGTLDNCTEIKVYCTEDNWAKISKVSDKWVSMQYISTTNSCATISQTTTDPISFGTPTVTPIPASGYDQLYSDRNGRVEVAIPNIRNLASDDVDKFSVKILRGTTDVTSSFSVSTSFNGVRFVANIQMTGAEGTDKYTPATYTVRISAGAASKDANFKIVGKYFNFTASHEKTGGKANNPQNFVNTWEVTIADQVAIDMSKFSYTITKNGVDCLNNYNVELNGNVFTIKNKTSRRTRPKKGTYVIKFVYSNPSYSDARNLSYTFEISIGDREITFERESVESYRYIRSKDNVPYTLEITAIKTTNNVSYISYIEGGTEYTLSREEFLNVYSDIDITHVTVAQDGRITYRYNELCIVTNYLNGMITYETATGETATVTKEEFQTLFPEAYAALMGGTYTFDDNGNLKLKLTGVKVVDAKRLSTKNQNIFATTGGEFYMVYRYADLDPEDFEEFDYAIYREDGTRVTEADEFYFSWTYDTTNAYIKIVYDNTDDEKYVGNYYVRINFEDAAPKDIPFVLYDAEIDFYLISQVDGHLSSSEPLLNEYPPSNQDYEYYVGFYLVKGGLVQNTKNASMIDVNIYDKLADLDDDGNIYYYEQINYEVRIKSYINGAVTYEVSEEGGKFTTKTSTLSDFTHQYEDAAELLDNYTYSATGEISSDNYPLHITRFYYDASIADMRVVYRDASNTAQSAALNDFKATYPEMYRYLITRFVFDASGNIILGAINGQYRITEKNGEPIVGKEVTDQFNISIDNSSTNVEKAITILPKTEVNPGVYYVYVAYDNKIGVGYVNDSEEAVITRDLYPEMWEQNIHMTMITYDVPVYSIDIVDPVLSNVGNTSKKIYNNIAGTAYFDLEVDGIFDFSGLSYEIEYYNGSSWEDASADFIANNTVMATSDIFDPENPYIELISNVGVVKTGKYRLTVNYTNNGVGCTATKEFDVSGKYYGLVIDDSETIKYVHNYTEEKAFSAKGYFINNPENIVPSIARHLASGADIDYIHDAANKRFTDHDGHVMFTYRIEVDYDYYEEEDTLLYKFYLSNIGDVTQMGNYTLSFAYQEGNNDRTVSEVDFVIGEDEYYFVMSNEQPRVTDTEMTLTLDIESRFIDYDILDEFQFVVTYYDTSKGQYVDVSSVDAENRMFIISTTWDQSTGPNYQGKIILTINPNRVDMNGDYILTGTFRTKQNQFHLSNLNELFAWDIETFEVVGKYHEVTTDSEGNEIETEHLVDGFYSNIEDTTINIKLNSIHENNVSWTINKECLENYCDPTTGTNYNDRFIATNTSGTDQNLSLKLKENIPDNEKLEPGVYALTLYYSITDYKVIRLEVHHKFVRIEFSEALIYSDITSEKVADGLFKNKTGHIYIPVKVLGVPYADLTVSITDANGGNNYSQYFVYDRDKFDNQQVLDIEYLKDSDIEPNNYLITVSYDTLDEIVSDNLNVTLNSVYYNFEINEPVYSRNPLIPNDENGGQATFKIDTEDIPNVTIGTNNIDALSNKHVFARNTVITNAYNEDVTNEFNITATNIVGEVTSFDLNISYESNTVPPGYYIVTTHFDRDGYIIKKSSAFTISDYLKTFTIENVQIITEANDNRIHRNIPGTYRVNYTSEFTIYPDNMNVIVTNESNEDVTANFDVTIYDGYIDVAYKAQEPYINSGEYKITINYQAPGSVDVVTRSTEVMLYATYKDITISNLEASSSTIYADKDNQYFTFDVDKVPLTDDDILALKARIYDSNDNLVYSDIASDNITNKFEVINNLNEATNNYRINVLAFAAPVSEYKIRLYLLDEDGEYNYSNELTFNIDSNYYELTLDETSNIKPKVTYGNDESIYSKEGAVGYYKFTSTYPTTDYSVYKIQIIKDGKVVKEIDANALVLEESGNSYLVSEFETLALDAGTYDIAICINSLPYAYQTITIKEYIPATKVTMIIDGTKVSGNFSMYANQVKKATFEYEPSNATDKNFIYSSSNTNIATFENGNIRIKGIGTTTITLKNSDITITANLTAERRLTSIAYTVNYDDYTIYVNKMTAKQLTKNTFISNLSGLVSGYKILNAANSNVTSSTQIIGTGYSIVNGEETYKVIVIGDVNGDGQIRVADVAMLHQHVRGRKRITNKYQLKAADIRKQNNIRTGDVAKLFQFVRNKINSI